MRSGKADVKTLLIVLLGVAVVVLLAVVLGRGPGPEGRGNTVEGTGKEPVTSARPTFPPPPPPDIIKVRKKEGNTYRTSIVGQVKGQALDKDWGFAAVTHYLYRWELLYDSKILKNDGVTIEEERRFPLARKYLVVSLREVNISAGWLLGVEAVGSVLGAPGSGAMVAGAEAELNKILGSSADVEGMKVKWEPFSIEGKTAILKLPDTMKSSDVQISGELSQEDRGFLRDVSLLLDARTLPKEDMKPGDAWTVDASELAVALDPGLDGKVVGTLRLVRREDTKGTAGTVAPLQMNLDATLRDRDARNAVQGQFQADGQGLFNKGEGVLETANLTGKATYEKVSTNHWLFEARQENKPDLEIEFKCYNLSDPNSVNIRGRSLDMEQFRRQAPKEIQQLME